MQQLFGAFLIFRAERLAIVVPEVEFCEVAVQRVVGSVPVNALHAALESGEEAFDGVGMDDGAVFGNIFTHVVPRTISWPSNSRPTRV